MFGAFLLLPRGPIFPIAGKAQKRRRLGYFPVAIAAAALVVASGKFPDALTIEFGIPIALFGAAGLRAAYLLAFRSRWTFCPKCGKESWILELDGKWYCNKKGHLFQETDSTTSEMPRGLAVAPVFTVLAATG
jgi:hypothetical protein